MRILFLDPCAQLGGAERCLLDMLASLRRTEPEFSLHLLTGESGPLLEEAARLGVSVESLAFPPQFARLGAFRKKASRLAWDCLAAAPAFLSYRAALSARIRQIAPDLIHSNGTKMHLLSACAGSIPIIWHLHDFAGARPAIAAALRLAAPRCRGAIAISESVARDAQETLRNLVPVSTMTNAVDLARFHPRGEKLDLDDLAGLPKAAPGTVRIGLVATFAKWKGHEVFLRALAKPELKGVRAYGIRAYIIGGPIYRTEQSQHSLAELQALVRTLGLEEQVGFTGFVSNSAAAMRSLDVVVHASTEPEPFGLVIAEAMACGRSVIASRGGGADEIYTDCADGVGVPRGDAEALAQAILCLARDPLARLRLGANARLTAEARFDRDRLGKTLSDLYWNTVLPCASSTSTAAIFTAA